MEQFLHVDVLLKTVNFYLCHVKKMLLEDIPCLHTCKSLFEIPENAGVGMMVSRSELHRLVH